jgi:hypothetical protein
MKTIKTTLKGLAVMAVLGLIIALVMSVMVYFTKIFFSMVVIILILVVAFNIGKDLFY